MFFLLRHGVAKKNTASDGHTDWFPVRDLHAIHCDNSSVMNKLH